MKKRPLTKEELYIRIASKVMYDKFRKIYKSFLLDIKNDKN